MTAAALIRAAVASGAHLGAQNVADLKIDLARQNDKRPAWVRLRVNDADVKALKGPAEKRSDELYLVRLPAEVVRELKDRQESRIIRPDDVQVLGGAA